MSDPDPNKKLVPPQTPELIHKFEPSIEFWVTDRDDNPPAIRGVIADIDDLPADVRPMIQRIGGERDNPQTRVQRLLWFEDTNKKLSEACREATTLFTPFDTDSVGLVSLEYFRNGALARPTRHRLTVRESFARTNYAPTGYLIQETDTELTEKSWKFKITQTLKPWSIRDGDDAKPVRPPSDLMLTLNALLSRTKHGWLVADFYKLRERLGAYLTYARTYEKFKQDGRAFEAKLELFGAAVELQKRMAPSLSALRRLYLQLTPAGDICLTKAIVAAPAADTNNEPIPSGNVILFNGSVALQDGLPGQIIIDRNDEHAQKYLQPLFAPNKPREAKLDARELASPQGPAFFQLRLRLNGPILIGSSGQVLFFSLPDFVEMFADSSLAQLRSHPRD